MKQYVLTQTDIELLRSQLEVKRRDEVLLREAGQSPDEIFRAFNFVLESWLAEVMR